MRVYLDTSAIVKRYVSESGSKQIDDIFIRSSSGADFIVLSYWNIGEAAVVFNKMSRKMKGHSEIETMSLMLNEFLDLARLQSISIIDVSQVLIRAAIGFVFKHHIYIADALQIAVAKSESVDLFISADGKLIEAASNEGLRTLYVK